MCYAEVVVSRSGKHTTSHRGPPPLLGGGPLVCIGVGVPSDLRVRMTFTLVRTRTTSIHSKDTGWPTITVRVPLPIRVVRVA